MICLKGIVYGLSFLLSVAALLPPGTDKCNGKADVVLAVPAESFESSAVFEKHLTDLMLYFSIAPTEIQIGLLLYGRKTSTVIPLTSYTNRAQVNTGITLLARRRTFFSEIGLGRQNLVKAMDTMDIMFASSNRAGHARKIGVIFSQGVISADIPEGEAVIAAAKTLQNSGVTMYNLGSNISQAIGPEFESIGTDRCRLFSIGSFPTGLRTVVPYLASAICSELDPTQTVQLPGNCFPKTYAKASPVTFSCAKAKEKFPFYPDVTNCAYYYWCIPGHPVYRMPCPDGTLYNPGLKRCDPIQTGLCY